MNFSLKKNQVLCIAVTSNKTMLTELIGINGDTEIEVYVLQDQPADKIIHMKLDAEDSLKILAERKSRLELITSMQK